MPASWNSETNTLKIYGIDWTTTAPYSLYISQPTPMTLEFVGYNSFVSNSTGIVSRSCLGMVGDTLEAKGGNVGIFSHALTINSGTLIASGETKAMEITNEVFLRTPPKDYDWWYTNKDTKGSGEFKYDPYEWIMVEVPPPNYELGASVNNDEPFINEDIEVTLTVKDITTDGGIYEFIDGTYDVALDGVLPIDFGITSPSSVQFNKGVGKLSLKPTKPGPQILHFSLEHPDAEHTEYTAINPLTITPLLPTASPDISLHTDSITFPDTTYGYSTQPPLNLIVENKNSDGTPTGELNVTVTGKDSASFSVSVDKVPTIAAGGSTVLQVTPLPGLDADTHTATIVVSGDRISEDKTLEVSFTVGKAPGAKVDTPNMATKTASSAFIYSIPQPSTGQEVEYAISETSNPQTYNFVTFSPSINILEFPELKSTTYYIFARSKENANYKAGDISVPLKSCIPFNEIAVALWGNNTLTVINNPANNVIGSKFSNFIWFRDEQEVGRGQSLSEYKDDKPLQPGKYHVEMTSKDGKLISCNYEISEPPPIVFTPTATYLTDEIYSISGKRLNRLNSQDLILKGKVGSKKTVKVGETQK